MEGYLVRALVILLVRASSSASAAVVAKTVGHSGFTGFSWHSAWMKGVENFNALYISFSGFSG